eukprot:1033319-Amphidinium_carterae.1
MGPPMTGPMGPPMTGPMGPPMTGPMGPPMTGPMGPPYGAVATVTGVLTPSTAPRQQEVQEPQDNRKRICHL